MRYGSWWELDARRITWVALGALAIARPIRAQPLLEPVDLSYRAPDTCPSFSQFLAELQHSTGRLRFGRAGESARHFEVVIEPNGRAGRLVLGGGGEGERDVSGADCVEVAGLLAFATALAADPDAQPPATLAGAVSSPTPSPVPVTSSSKQSPEPPRAVAESPCPRAPEPAPRARTRTKWSVADFGFATGASAPAVTWGGGAFAELELGAVALAPRFRVGAEYAFTTREAAPGSVGLSNELVSIEACSGALTRKAFTFLPCVRAEGGVRIATGHDLPGARSEWRPDFDLGAAAHVRWRFAGPAFFEVGGALLFPTVRDDVVVQRGASDGNVSSVYRLPTVGVMGEFALGVEFGDQGLD